MKPIVRIEHVSKSYRIGAHPAAYSTLRESLTHAVRAPLKLLQARRNGQGDGEVIWALNDVTFEVLPGEVVGIIGRNGAGKSTLLKVLSCITEPTSGRIELYGRVGSLLEVGTGFHPELTGRENILLNGAILGMKRPETLSKFDEIVAFAELEKFIDTPVKRYSSGMYLRLAFAVAAHLEPEILIVDEVLAVGDARFQRKCLEKMEDVGEHGRTVLFVSHNMTAVTRLCPRTILLHEGEVVQDGPSHEVVTSYLNSGMGTTAHREWPDADSAPGNEVARLRAVRVKTEDGLVAEVMDIRRPIRLEVEYDVLEGGYSLFPAFGVYNEEGTCIFLTLENDATSSHNEWLPGHYASSVLIPGNFFSEGTLVVGVSISQHVPLAMNHAHYGEAVAFKVIDVMAGDSVRGDYHGPYPGVVRPKLPWKTQFEPAKEFIQA